MPYMKAMINIWTSLRHVSQRAVNSSPTIFSMGLDVDFRGMKKNNKVIASSKEGCSIDKHGLTVMRDKITTWLTSDDNDLGVQMLTNSKICDLVSKSCDDSEPHIDSDKEQGDSEESLRCPVLHSEAAHVFRQCLRWLECPMRSIGV